MVIKRWSLLQGWRRDTPASERRLRASDVDREESDERGRGVGVYRDRYNDGERTRSGDYGKETTPQRRVEKLIEGLNVDVSLYADALAKRVGACRIRTGTISGESIDTSTSDPDRVEDYFWNKSTLVHDIYKRSKWKGIGYRMRKLSNLMDDLTEPAKLKEVKSAYEAIRSDMEKYGMVRVMERYGIII